MSVHLKNAPLVEALLELRWELQDGEPSRDAAYPLIVGLLYEQVKKDYPFIEALPQSRLPAEVIPFFPTHRFRISADQWPLVQIGPGIATLNFTDSYGWEQFQTAALEFIEHLKGAYDSAVSLYPHLRQITLRYINALPFQFEDQDVYDFLRNKLHIALTLPKTITETSTRGLAASLNLKVSYPLDRPQGTGVLNIGRGEKSGAQALVWDLILVSTGSEIPGLEGVAPWLSDAHNVLEKWFFTLVEGELLDEFKGEG